MTKRTVRRALRAGVLAAAALGALAASAGEPLRLVARTDLSSYKGDFDHFAADIKGQRLFLAGEDGGTLEVFDLRSGAHTKTVGEMGTPHAIHFDAARNRLVVTSSANSGTKELDGSSFRVLKTLDIGAGADVMAHDPSVKALWIVAGGKNADRKLPYTTVAQVDAGTGKVLGTVRFETDFTEGIVAEQKGSRVFVNLAGKSQVAVLDKRTRQVLDTWPVQGGEHNSAIDLDEKNARLFVITRKPFKLLVLDSRNGKTVAAFDAPPRTNGVAYDAANGRIYATGDGHVAVYRQDDADHYAEEAKVPSAFGAKTSILVPEVHRLFVAVAGSDKQGAGLLTYEVLPQGRH